MLLQVEVGRRWCDVTYVSRKQIAVDTTNPQSRRKGAKDRAFQLDGTFLHVVSYYFGTANSNLV